MLPVSTSKCYLLGQLKPSKSMVGCCVYGLCARLVASGVRKDVSSLYPSTSISLCTILCPSCTPRLSTLALVEDLGK